MSPNLVLNIENATSFLAKFLWDCFFFAGHGPNTYIYIYFYVYTHDIAFVANRMSLFSDSTKTSDYSTPKLAKRPTRNSRSKELINHRCPFRRPYSIVKGVMVLSFKIPHR